ncbi:MAG: hypothetical protein IPP74_09590 [Alphaproteobacteria bacterium]|nr:hypothetical protein [Alphaproteobacteria bacterium]
MVLTYDDKPIELLSLHDIEEERERIQGLYRAVVLQAIIDATYRRALEKHCPLPKKRRHQELKEAKIEAIHWLNPHNEDFQAVCHMADLSPKHVYFFATQMIREANSRKKLEKEQKLTKWLLDRTLDHVDRKLFQEVEKQHELVSIVRENRRKSKDVREATILPFKRKIG